MIKCRFHADGIDVAILADGGSVVCHFARRSDAAIAERILAIRGYEFGIRRDRHRFAEADVEQQTWIDKRKTACTHLRFHVEGLACLKTRTASGEVDTSRSTKLARRLPDVGLLTVVELDLFDVFERIFAEVDLSVLGIAKLYTIVIHTHMVGTHGADIHGLYAPYSTIIFDLHAREIANGIGYAEGIHLLELHTRKCLRDNDILLFNAGGNSVLLQLQMTINGVKIQRISGVSLRECHYTHECEKYYGYYSTHVV